MRIKPYKFAIVPFIIRIRLLSQKVEGIYREHFMKGQARHNNMQQTCGKSRDYALVICDDDEVNSNAWGYFLCRITNSDGLGQNTQSTVCLQNRDKEDLSNSGYVYDNKR